MLEHKGTLKPQFDKWNYLTNDINREKKKKKKEELI